MFTWVEDKWLWSQQVLYKLVESMPAGGYAVIKVKGENADYLDTLKFLDIFQRYNFSLKL